MQSFINEDNKKLAENLRRLADRLEKSDQAHHWCMRATASDPVSVTVAFIDGPSGVGASPMRASLFIGDEKFVSRMNDHFDQER